MSAYARLLEDLDRGRVVVIDGATGTELERRGAPMHERAWCAMATQTAPELLRAVHEDYIRAGARLITANTFSSNRNMLGPAGLGDQFEALNRAALALALEARERCNASERVTVAGSISHQVPLLETGAYDPQALPSPELAAERFREMAALLADAGAEMILLEMMSDPDLANPAIEAVRETGLPFWVGFSVRPGEDGLPVSYRVPRLSASQMYAAVRLDGADAAGVMHSSIDVTAPALDALRAVWSGRLLAYPDSGFFRMPHWEFTNIISPSDLVERSRTWVGAGVRVLGGCCGLGVEHVDALARAWNTK